MYQNAKEINRFLIENWLKDPRVIVDATLGNGYDTEFLQGLFPQARIYAFDIQEEAVRASRARLGQQEKVSYIWDSHARLSHYVKEPIDFVIFNLGYLPGGDKAIVTQGEEVVEALKQITPMLTEGGLVSLTFYPGHEAGRRESLIIEDYLGSLDQKYFTVSKIAFCNQKNNPPYCIWVEKRKG